MLYRLLKRLFCIRTNVAKKKMFKVLGIKNGDEYVKEIMKQFIYREKEASNLVEYLSIKVIKIKLDCLFQRKSLNPKCSCYWQIDSKHVINMCSKTTNWRDKLNKESEKIWGMTIWESFNTLKITDNTMEAVNLLNNAAEDLIRVYLGEY